MMFKTREALSLSVAVEDCIIRFVKNHELNWSNLMSFEGNVVKDSYYIFIGDETYRVTVEKVE